MTNHFYANLYKVSLIVKEVFEDALPEVKDKLIPKIGNGTTRAFVVALDKDDAHQVYKNALKIIGTEADIEIGNVELVSNAAVCSGRIFNND